MVDIFFIIIGLIALAISLSSGVNIGLLLISLLIIGRHGLSIFFRNKERKSAEGKGNASEEKTGESNIARRAVVTLRIKDVNTGEENVLVFNDGESKYIGRSSKADIRVDDIYFGALSCVFKCTNGKIIMWNQSKNGAWVLWGDEWVTADTGIEVMPGDTIKVVNRIYSIEGTEEINSLKVRFRIIQGNRVQRVRLVDNQPIFIGRSPEAQICIQDLKISRIHCSIYIFASAPINRGFAFQERHMGF